MIAVSSFKPLDDDAEYAANQLAAKATWETAFDSIVFFNQPDERMASEKTAFIPWDGHPRIYDMLDLLGEQDQMGCLINADIIIGPMFRMMEEHLLRRMGAAAVSHRQEFDPKIGLKGAKVVDQGLDFFCALPQVWRSAARVVPCDYRIGHQMFDTWLIGFLNVTCGRRFFDISDRQLFFHPKHGGRKFVYSIEQHDDPCLAHCGMPMCKL